MSTGFKKYLEMTPAQVGINGAVMTAQHTATFGTRGWAQLVLGFNHSAHAGATSVAPYIEWSPDEGTTWIRPQTVTWAAGVGTLNDMSWLRALAAADQFVINIPVNYDLVRLTVPIAGGAPAAGDLLSVWARLES